MSLDVYLEGEQESYECPHCGQVATRSGTLYSANITHNLNRMADAAGIYEACWRPEKIGVTKAAELIPLLESGLARLKEDPAYFRTFNANNRWGVYEDFVPWVEEYLTACREHPKATVRASR